MKKTLITFTLLGLVLAQAAAAHVEPTPAKIKAGSVAKVTFEVPAEEKVPAVRLAMQLPASLTQVRLHPTPGWNESLKGRVATWSGGRIPPGKSAHFSLTARWPNTPGRTLVFPSVEVYPGLKDVYWIGPESAQFPAARVTLTGAPNTATVTTTAASTKTDGSSNNNWIWIAIAAVILGALAAVFLVRRRRA